MPPKKSLTSPPRTSPKRRRIVKGRGEPYEIVISDNYLEDKESKQEMSKVVVQSEKLDDEEEEVKPTFRDTDTSLEKDKFLHKWGEIFRKFKEEEYPYVIPSNNLDKLNYYDNAYANIIRSHLHMIATRSPIFPCYEAIG